MPIIGKILTTFGNKGEVKLLPYVKAEPSLVEGQKGVVTLPYRTREVEIERVRVHKGMWLVKFKGIDTIKEGWRLRGGFLEVDVPLPEEEDYIGYEVETEKGRKLGRVVEIIPTPAHKVLVTTNEAMLPLVEEVLVKIDKEAKKLIAKELKGL